MTSSDIVKMYDARLEGQQLLFPDDDLIIRKTKFKKIDPEFDKNALIHWWMNVYLPEYKSIDEQTPFEVYKTWSNALWEYFKYTMLSGYNCEINQQAVKFCGYLKEPVDEQTEELRSWLPYIKPSLDEDNGRMGKYIGIMERSCSAEGIWHLWVCDDKIYLGRTRYHRYEERATFDSLGKAIWFVCNHYWYDKKLRR